MAPVFWIGYNLTTNHLSTDHGCTATVTKHILIDHGCTATVTKHILIATAWFVALFIIRWYKCISNMQSQLRILEQELLHMIDVLILYVHYTIIRTSWDQV